MPKHQKKGEVQVQKSPAEFFAENQAIAGFDNLGKSLYTSIRELVENSLDACEAIEVLPEISVEITEYSQDEFNALTENGSGSPRKRIDEALFAKKKTSQSKKKESAKAKQRLHVGDSEEEAPDDYGNDKPKARRKKAPQDAYFRVLVSDNGCGMRHAAIPDLFGRVLSGSKYGVRQTRGKFGLGAKMALIWSKKSSGRPIRISTAHRYSGDDEPPSKVSKCVLDIDIYKNEPKILEHRQLPNADGKVGTQVEVLIAGNWTTYRSRILQYLQQLAIITPYAALSLQYENVADSKRNFDVQYARRSEQMPPPASTVKHHPSSVNNLVIQQLIQFTKTKTMVKFLSTELASVTQPLAKRIVAELKSSKVTESTAPNDLSDKQITRLVQLLKQVQLFKAPDGECLSPAGEYNLNLGIRQVLEPELIATSREKTSAHEGHPFIVEAAVSLGGNSQVKEGITVLRFANRIPLLFEGGADVATRVAHGKIKWGSYKIDQKKDKVGVFVSIVSTKIPFKGTSKEYIGDDATEIQESVKKALQNCCKKLRVHLLKRNAARDAAQRKSRLSKYIPDVSRSLYGILDGMQKRHAEDDEADGRPNKRRHKEETQLILDEVESGSITEKSIQSWLRQAVHEENLIQEQEARNEDDAVERHYIFLKPHSMEAYAKFNVTSDVFSFRPLEI